MTETSLWSPKCSSQNLRESTCFNLFDALDEYVCSWVACTRDSRCFRNSDSQRSISSSALSASLPFPASVRQIHTPPPAEPPSLMSLSTSFSSSSMHMWMFSSMTVILLSSMEHPSIMLSIWLMRREHLLAVDGRCSAALILALISLHMAWSA